MDTKYFLQALDEYRRNGNRFGAVGVMVAEELSKVLRRAQELKDLDATAAKVVGNQWP